MNKEYLGYCSSVRCNLCICDAMLCSKTICIILCVVVLSMVNGYTSFSGSCYKLHVTPALWDDAQRICSAEGGYLAVINDADEAQVVTKLATDVFESWLWLYIGIRLKENGQWQSVLGNPLDEIYNTWLYKRSYYHCGAIDWEGLLDSLNCSWKKPFICEKKC